MSKQKFATGDRVMIAKDLGKSMGHFDSGVAATVAYTYHQRYGGGNTTSYCLKLPKRGEVSWYEEHQLTLIKGSSTNRKPPLKVNVHRAAKPPAKARNCKSLWRDTFDSMHKGDWFRVGSSQAGRVRSAARKYAAGKYTIYKSHSGDYVCLFIK